MTATVPTSEPTQVVAGDTVKFTREFSNYSPVDGWTLSYGISSPTRKLAPISGSQVTSDGNKFVVTVPSSVTLTWEPGTYRWQSYVQDSSSPPLRYTLGTGTLVVLPNLETGEHKDLRTQNQRILDAIRALLEGKVASDVQQYTIGGRQLVKMTLAELQAAETTYAMRVAMEGGTMSRTMKVRFTQ